LVRGLARVHVAVPHRTNIATNHCRTFATTAILYQILDKLPLQAIERTLFVALIALVLCSRYSVITNRSNHA
jgi:hypothetical protein